VEQAVLAGLSGAIRGVGCALARSFLARCRARRDRRLRAVLDDHLLRDIGLDRAAARPGEPAGFWLMRPP
jgi:uncharacterized protein YjiS (DUF1127 family)